MLNIRELLLNNKIFYFQSFTMLLLNNNNTHKLSKYFIKILLECVFYSKNPPSQCVCVRVIMRLEMLIFEKRENLAKMFIINKSLTNLSFNYIDSFVNR